MRDLTELKRIQKAVKTNPTWVGVSQELTKEGIDPERVFIADNFPDDSCQEYWLIVTYDKKIFEFYYDWLHSKDPSKGKITEWHDFTDEPQKVYMHKSVNEVLMYFDSLLLDVE